MVKGFKKDGKFVPTGNKHVGLGKQQISGHHEIPSSIGNEMLQRKKTTLDDYERDNLIDDTSMEEQLYDVLFEYKGYPEKYKQIRRDYIFGHNTDLDSLFKQYGVTEPRAQRGITSFFRWAEKHWEGESNAIRNKQTLDDSDSKSDEIEERIAKLQEAKKLLQRHYIEQGNKYTKDQTNHLEGIDHDVAHLRTELENRRKK